MRRGWAPTVAMAILLTACAGPSVAPSAVPSASGRASAPTLSPSATPSGSPSPSASAPAPTTISWSALGATGPAAREDHTWTVSGDGSTALLFGGRDGATVFGDLWAYSLRDDAWIELPASPGPAARFGHEAVWVDGIGLVVFAGQAGTDFFNDLWAYDPAAGTWRLLPSDGAVPVARYGTCAALAPDGRLWISHGFTADGVRFADTRAYDFDSGTWTDETPSGRRPVERCLHACWWTDDGTLALFGGQTTGVTALGDHWLLDGATWSDVEGASIPARNLYAAVRLPGATLVFGGQGVDGTHLDDAWWLGDGGDGTRQLTRLAGGPGARSGAAMVADPATGRVLLFGGRDADGAFADTWQVELTAR